MVEDESADRSMVITVDGTPITLGDFETMMESDAEVKRIRDTYLQDSVDLTPEQAGSLYSLYEQLSENGIMLYNTQGADDLVFPSGINHGATVSVSLDRGSVSGTTGGTVTATYTVSGAEDGQTVSFDVYVLPGSAADWVTAKRNTSKSPKTAAGLYLSMSGSWIPLLMIKPGMVNKSSTFTQQIFKTRSLVMERRPVYRRQSSPTASALSQQKSKKAPLLRKNSNLQMLRDTF